MALSSVNICNMAFGLLRSDKIEAFSPTERSPNAKRALLWYDPSRKQVLEGFDWNFARKQQPMNVSSDDAPLDWEFRYDVPADCISPRRIFNPLGQRAPAIPYDQLMHSNGVTKTILTNMGEAELVYTFDQAAVDLFPMSYVTLLSYLLAANLAYEVTGKDTVQTKWLQAYMGASQWMPGSDANQQVPHKEPDVDWIRART